MPNDSSTGGYLAPSSNNDLNDDALQDFLQTIVVGISGLPGAMVRPRWQTEPPNQPDITVNWAAIGTGTRTRDDFAYRRQVDSETHIVYRNRIFPVTLSFYGQAAEANAELFIIGLTIPQNRDEMNAQGFKVVGRIDGPVIAPALMKKQWYRKADVSFDIRQQQQYTYSVLTLLGATATLSAGNTKTNIMTESISVTAPD